jgi:hypothetical protein
MPGGAASIANRIAQAMSQNQQPPQPQDQQQGQNPPTTLTPEYQAKNKADIQNTFQYDPSMDYNAKLRSFFGLSN